MLDELKRVLVEIIGLSEESVSTLAEEFDESEMQRHAMHCLYAMDKGRVKNPPAWYTASLRNDWSAPYGMPSGWQPKVLRFRVDDFTFVEIERDVRQLNRKEN
jgi:hypothetical protein